MKILFRPAVGSNLRRRRLLVLIAPACVIATALGSVSPALARPVSSAVQARPSAAAQARPTRSALPVSTTRSLRSLNQERRPAGSSQTRWVVRDPVAYRQAEKTGNWVTTPEGLSYKTCVYSVPSHGVLWKNEIISPNGAIRKITPCQHPTITASASATPSASAGSAGQARPGTTAPSSAAHGTILPAGACNFGPGGSYWAASCYGSSPSWVTSFDQKYAVPSNPAQTGALIFLWGGIENANGSTLLQDVLTWGANGGIVTQPNIWYVNNWYLWPSNNSVHSASMHVNPNDTIVADLTASNCTTDGHCTWVLTSTDTVSGSATSITIGSGVGFDLLIGSDMEVPRAQGCIETPASGHAAFRNLTVKGNTGTITPTFGVSFPDPQCSITMNQTSSASDILWKTS